MTRSRKVLIIGGTGDIGKSISKKFEKDELISVGSSDLDLLDIQNIDKFFHKHRDFNFEVFIFASGINNPLPISQTKYKDFQDTMQVNCNAIQYIFSSNFKSLTKLESFVAIGSLYSEFSRKNRSSYSMSKHALFAFVKSLSIEMAKRNMTANLVSPGFIETKLTIKNNSKDKIKKISSMIPLSNLGKPEDIANAVFFLTQEESKYITGINLIVDGGFSTGGFQAFLDE